jgi:hypothetical protein
VDLLRRHLFFIVCGFVGAAGIALAVTGWGATPKVRTAVDEAKQLYDQLGTIKPVNRRSVEASKQRIAKIVEDRNAIIEQCKSLYRYPPLVPDVFPNGNPESRRRFLKVYNEEMRKLMDLLHWGRPASDSDFEAMKNRIEEEAFRRKQLGGADPTAGPEATPAGVLTEAGIRKDPQARAHLAAAQRIYCYAVDFDQAKPPEIVSSLFLDPAMKETGKAEPPDLVPIWRAQVGYWIQKDIVEAIAALNEEAAAAARERDQDRWVGIMPVKEVISIRPARQYVKPSNDKYVGMPPGGYTEAQPPAAQKTAFTQAASNEFFEVTQVSVKLIMDQRDIPALIEKICAGGFYIPLRVAYRAVEPNRTMKGKIYGSEPAVNVVMDFEVVMVGEFFRKVMPPAACQEFGIPCPGVQVKPQEEDEDE